MEERNEPACRATPRACVEQPKSEPGKPFEGLLHVVDRVGDVVQATTAFRKEVRDLRVATRAAKQLDTRAADLEHHRLDAVGFDAIAVRRRRIGQALILGNGSVEVGHGDADVVDAVETSHSRPSIGSRSLTGLQRNTPVVARVKRTPYDRGVRLRRLILGGLFVFTLVFAAYAFEHMFPPQPYGIADDWRVFYAASTVVQHGGNPYDPATIHAAEQAAEHYQHVQPSLDDFTDLPVVAIALRAVTWLPFWWSYAVFTVLGAAVAAAVLWIWMRDAGWRTRAVWLLGAMASWPVLLGVFSGQFDFLVLGGTVGSLLLMRRDGPVAAGVCMAVVLLKPHLLWPLPLLLFSVWLFDPRRAWRFAATTISVLGAGTLAGFLFVPQSAGFLGHVLGFGSRVGSDQPDLSGLPGMVLHLPGGAAAAVAIAAAGIVAVFALAVRAARSAQAGGVPAGQAALITLTGLAVWLSLTPYAHPNDDVLLFPLLVLLLRQNGRQISGRALAYGAVGAAGVGAAFIASAPLGYAVIAVGVAGLAFEWRRLTPEGIASAGLAALAILPVIWPFHVLQAPVTPVAVTLIALAGVLRVREILRAPTPSLGHGERRGRVGGVVVEAASALATQPAGRH